MKKETQLSILREIRDLLKAQLEPKKESIPNGHVLFDFPEVTAAEIIKKAKNKTSKSTPILYNIDSWYKNEDFYLKEKTRPGKRYVSLTVENKYQTWDECNNKGEMLNFAEILYVMVEHEKKTGVKLLENEWSWTSSVSSGGFLVYLGFFDSLGASVGGAEPGSSVPKFGVLFSRSLEN